jgi:site-specific recombinase XerD
MDLDHCQVHVVQGNGSKDLMVLFPSSFRGELGQYIHGQRERRAAFLFESNRLRPYSTRHIRHMIHQYAAAAGIQKRVYPHLCRHQIITFLTRKGIISPKLQLLSGHAEENSLAIYRDLALAHLGVLSVKFPRQMKVLLESGEGCLRRDRVLVVVGDVLTADCDCSNSTCGVLSAADDSGTRAVALFT